MNKDTSLHSSNDKIAANDRKLTIVGYTLIKTIFGLFMNSQLNSILQVDIVIITLVTK